MKNAQENKPYWSQIRENVSDVSHPHRVIAMCIPVVIILLVIIAACITGYLLTK